MNENTLTYSSAPGLRLLGRGKVRDIYDLDDALLIVATDRISCFDVVLPTPIPGKGRVLTEMSRFWFEKTRHIVPNHFCMDLKEPLKKLLELDALAGRAMIVQKAEPLPVEVIVRGYLAGSAWKEYRQQGTVCGVKLSYGLCESEKLPEPIFTPATKAPQGEHDENISFEQMARIVGAELAESIRQASQRLYTEAAACAAQRGIIIADTKFEFGLVGGILTLIDEVLTPDSSRFWPMESYRIGTSPPSFDKQYVRDYLEGLGWNKQPPAPELPEEVIRKTSQKYVEALRLLCGDETQDDWARTIPGAEAARW
ncbi:MAG: phosphoribosylaminoimidazolesuccinocarboxamide synthase [Verrucomicrobia bacterium]|nr:phosphoribosylaminoimidazolesuccinocarboxamide synthase [Verrucomicrobiota bacterium]MBU4292215.1 phosphoribosylaminoimidazolesuccinocarboxamide synthase [Verrucomicrobiota bacterium]MBU4496398.1 phosphoribosylaminoimidazolesuccinocarboxamide synthase [Verrucomicrobiota bacterium]MCG2680436.1 phosphoribosylaminoimidazolesuccinocarboxamide synthase [Kiritimatiellia bacterium]